jgi:hypothetical protein
MPKIFVGVFALVISVMVAVPALPQQPRNQPGASSQPPTADERGTNNLPLIVKLAPTPQSQAEAAEKSDEEKDQLSSNWWLVRATWLLAIIGLLQLCVFGLQARRLRQTIKTMDETAVRQLRAYVSAQMGVGNIPVQNLTSTAAVNTHVLIYNHGRTPAYQVEVLAGIDVLPYPLSANYRLPAVTPPPRPISKTVIHPDGHTINGTFSAAPISAFQMNQIQTGSHRLYVFGTIKYIDAFKKPRTTTFCAAVQLLQAGVTWAQIYAGNGSFMAAFEFPDQHNAAD